MVWHSKGAMWVEGHGNAGRQLKTDGASQLCISTDTTSKPSVPSGSVCIHSVTGMPACMEGQPGSVSRRMFLGWSKWDIFMHRKRNTFLFPDIPDKWDYTWEGTRVEARRRWKYN